MTDSTKVATNKGLIKGECKDGICIWKGIPYAKAPVGDLRFRRAQEHDSWDDVMSCTSFGNKCWQFGGGKFQSLLDSSTPASEDCLYLNVWSKMDGNKKPVFVYIHGGGQYSGEASSEDYDLTAFARDDAVAVSFNYRLGVLGFFDFSKYSDRFESNCAISDMIMALKWVNENIEAFGGDKTRVTLCGESAGATCTMALLGSKEARSYFQRAVIMSGVLYNITQTKIQDYNNKIFFERTGISEDNIEAVLDMDYETLLDGCKCRFEGIYTDKPGILVSGPVIDDIITSDPVEAAKKGYLSDKEILIGTCENEGGLFRYMNISFNGFANALEVLHKNGYSDRTDEFIRVYSPKKAGSDSEREAIDKFCTDLRFFAGSVKLAKALSASGDVFMYRFDFTTPVSRLIKVGATHTMDIAAAFDVKGTRLYKFAKGDKTVKRNLHNAFLQFIKSGNPGWDKYTLRNPMTMLVNREMKLEKGPRDEFAQLWEDIKLYE